MKIRKLFVTRDAKPPPGLVGLPPFGRSELEKMRKKYKEIKFALLLKPRKMGRLREKVTRRRAGCQYLVEKLHPISHSMVPISDSTDRELKIEEFRAKGDCNTENTKKDSESSTERE